jgi:hypothetical protein
MENNANSNLTAIAGAAALVVSLVGLFVLTGVVGRVQRNEAGLFVAGMGTVVVAALVLLIAEQVGPTGAPADTARGARTLRIGASVLGTIGILLAVAASVSSARTTERPVVTGSFSSGSTTEFTATAKASNLSSSRRVIVIVDGLSGMGANWEAHTIYQAYLGPDSDGKVDHHVTLQIPQDSHYAAVGVKAYTGLRDAAFDDTPCSTYPRQVSQPRQADRFSKQGPGCVILATTAATPTATADPTTTTTRASGG